MIEMVAVTVIGVVAPFLGIICWQIFAERRHAKDIDYKKWHTKQIIKNPIMRVPSKQVREIIQPAPTEQPNLLGLLKGLDIDNLKGLLGTIQKKDDIDLEEYADEGNGSVLDSIMNYAQDNPEVVQGFLKGLNKNKEQDQGGVQFE